MSRWIVLCKDCGGTEEAHHPFVPMMPSGCVCDPRDWHRESVTVPCKAFVEQPAEDYCARCEHDRECHAQFTPCGESKEEA